MVSFDAATMYGTKFEDMGTWKPVFHEEFDELKNTAPEVWLFEVDENHFIDADERRFQASMKTSRRVRETFWERQRTLSLPRLSDVRRQVTNNYPRIEFQPTKFVALTQPNSREVLLLVPTKFYWDAHFHESKTIVEKSRPPFYLQIIVDEMVLESFLDIESCEISVLTEIRDFDSSLPDIKLLNWMESSPLLDFVDVAPNPLRPFLWYLELKPFLSPDNRDYNGTESFGGFKRVIQRPYGFYNPYLDNRNYGLLPTTVETLDAGYIRSKVPSVSWNHHNHTLDWGWEKSMMQWVGDDPKYQAETFNSENSYEIMMAHDYTTLPKRGLCPICDGAIPNNETPGAYPGALSRFDNETEVCSACGSAEALTPMFSEEGKDLMVAGIQNDEWDWWKAGVLMGREPVDEMMEASKRASVIMKEKGFTEGKPGD